MIFWQKPSIPQKIVKPIKWVFSFFWVRIFRGNPALNVAGNANPDPELLWQERVNEAGLGAQSRREESSRTLTAGLLLFTVQPV